MKIPLYAAVILFSLAMQSCVTQSAYYMSPLDVRANSYATLPMFADSQKSITTAGLAFQAGGSNENLRDELVGGVASIMQSHHFGHFQGYYGGVFGAGSYADKGEDALYSSSYNGFDTSVYSIQARNRFYGYYGLNGGINLVVPFPGYRGEWRAIGLDVAYRREFGQYQHFRKDLNSDFVDLNAAYRQFFSIGASTEILARNWHGVQFSYKMAAGGMIYDHDLYKGFSNGSKPFYFSHTLAITKNRVTGYIQVTAGTHAFALQTGVNVSLRRRTQAIPHVDYPARKRREKKPRNYKMHPLRPFEKRRPNPGEYD